MSITTRRPGARWALPASVVVLAAGGVVASRAADAATPTLPARTATQLLTDLAGASATPLSGTVQTTADLGLPSLPTTGSSDDASTSSLASGTHTLRVWTDGATRSRVAVLSPTGESDVVRSGSDVWAWSSADKTAVHRTLTSSTVTLDPSTGTTVPSLDGLTPEQAAQRVLAAVDPTTSVTSAGTSTVAGRSAYDLVVAPRGSGSLVGRVEIAVDAEHHVPLSVRVVARGASDPAASVAFTSVDFAAPAASEFAFTPPAGTKVTEEDGTGKHRTPTAAARPTVVGEGWTAVVVARAPETGTGSSATASSSTGPADLASVLASLPRVSGSWGSGRLLTSALVSVLVTDDGRVLAGAVPAARVEQVAGQTASSAG